MDLKYPDKKQFNVYKQQNKKRREARISALVNTKDEKAQVTYAVWEASKHPRSRTENSRLCSDDIVLLKEHLVSFKGSHDDTGRKKYIVYNKECYCKCTLCQGAS